MHPLEARRFFGVPDVQPLQATVMAEVEKKILSEMERLSPESVLKTWLPMVTQAPDQRQDALSKMMSAGLNRTRT